MKKIKQFKFDKAFKLMKKGKMVRRLYWRNVDFTITIKDGKIITYFSPFEQNITLDEYKGIKTETSYEFKLSSYDVMGKDWVLVKD
jgi:hypothetical protein